MEYIVLLFGISLLVLFTFFFSEGDILMPSIILNISYGMSLIILLLSPYKIKFHWNTVGIILIGLFSFQFIELLFYVRYHENTEHSYVIKYPAKLNLMIIIIIQILALLLYISEIKRIGRGTNLWESVLNMRRIKMYASSLQGEDYVGFLASRLMKINFAAGYVSTFFTIRNAVYSEKHSFIKLHLISVFIYLIQAMMSGGRSQLLRLFFGGMIIVFIINRLKDGWKSRVNFSTMLKIVIGVAAAGSLFYNTRVFFGRKNQMNLSFGSVLAAYYSGGIYLFDGYLQHPIRNYGELVGSQTFKDFFNLLYKYGLRSSRIIPQLEFKTMGETVNNTYTAFRYYYQDFGIAGVIILQIVLSIIFNQIYKKIKVEKREQYVIIYSFVFFALIMHCILDQFFSILSFGYVETLGWIFILYAFETRVRLLFGTRTVSSI